MAQKPIAAAVQKEEDPMRSYVDKQIDDNITTVAQTQLKKLFD